MPANLKILYVEDDADDIEFMKMALSDEGINYKLETIMRGDLVMDRLQNGSKPDIIVMDLNLPKIHGRELVKKIKSEKRLRDTPLLVLTTSSLQEDINFCYREGADHYLTKPADADGFALLSQTIVGLAGGKRGTVNLN
jgi:CheY-like chemotaxis protein